MPLISAFLLPSLTASCVLFHSKYLIGIARKRKREIACSCVKVHDPLSLQWLKRIFKMSHNRLIQGPMALKKSRRRYSVFQVFQFKCQILFPKPDCFLPGI